jgi:hypothetical protein
MLIGVSNLLGESGEMLITHARPLTVVVQR